MIDFIKRIAEEAGGIALERQKTVRSADIDFKSDKDLVTDVDRAVEDYLIKRIRSEYPDHSILGEETGRTGGSGDHTWVIDPIDGTTSFVHDQPFFSISIGVMKGDEPVAGVVRAPRLDETYHAEKGKGAFLNGNPVRVSKRDQVVQSVLGTGFACLRSDLEINNLPYFNKIAAVARGVRRYGSAAMDLCFVACGRLEGFWELNLKIYDVAAGILMVREAGGNVFDFSGGPDYPDKGIVATNGLIDEEMLSFLQ